MKKLFERADDDGDVLVVNDRENGKLAIDIDGCTVYLSRIDVHALIDVLKNWQSKKVTANFKTMQLHVKNGGCARRLMWSSYVTIHNLKDYKFTIDDFEATDWELLD